MRYFFIQVTIVFLLQMGCLPAVRSQEIVQPSTVGLSEKGIKLIDKRIGAAIEDGQFIGAVFLVARKGKVAHLRPFGFSNKRNATVMKTDSLFRIYSMTKPIVSVAALMLNEEGKLLLSDPVHKHLPEFRDIKVFTDKGKAVSAETAPTIQDLLRHTSGITYSLFGDSPVHKRYREYNTLSWDQTSAEFITKMSQIPLAHNPGTIWNYGQSTDVLARIIEVISKKPLNDFLEEKIFKPLGMKDTAYVVADRDLDRVAEQSLDGNGNIRPLHRVDRLPTWIPGGHGLISTAQDYWRFAQMLLNGGHFQGIQLLSDITVKHMTSDHLQDNIAKTKKNFGYVGAGYGFGLGVAVRLHDGMASWSGSKGDYYWLGIAGTNFLVSPENDFISIFLAQEWMSGLESRNLIFSLVSQTILNKDGQ